MIPVLMGYKKFFNVPQSLPIDLSSSSMLSTCPGVIPPSIKITPSAVIL